MSAIAGRVLLIPKGNYDSTATYTMLDMVVYNGSSYICKQECTGVVPTNTTYWMLNASGSAVAYINDIGDVVITNVSNGQVLMYDSTTQKWVNGTLTLNSITDTQFASLTNGQVLKYNATSQKWENADEKGGILPHLIVISETGSTVTATKGQTVITATETSTGHFECDLTELGTWTIDAILGGDDAQVSLVVDTVKVYTVDDSHFHGTLTVKYPDGATCRLQSADETLYATGSPYTFTVHHAETYTITVTYNQRIYTDTVTFTTEGQSFSKTLPSPSEVDANDINLWLFFGGVSGTFSSLADILANSTALSSLMASTDAVDYLVRCKDWIGSEDGLVPIMTSNTTPSGEVTYSSCYNLTSYPPYYAFDNNVSTKFTPANSDILGQAYIGYKFTTPTIVNKCHIVQSQNGIGKVHIVASNDNFATSVVLLSNIDTTNNDTNITFNNSTAYTEYRLYIDEFKSGVSQFASVELNTLQFYKSGITTNESAMSYIGLNNYCANTLLADADWLDGIANSTYFESVLNAKVPTMTSATTPSGVVSVDSIYDNDHSGWKAFDGNDSSYWITNASGGNKAWINYQFNSSARIMSMLLRLFQPRAAEGSWVLSASTDGSSYTNLVTFNVDNNWNNVEKIVNVNNNQYYKYYKITTASMAQASKTGAYTIQFYGRADV